MFRFQKRGFAVYLVITVLIAVVYMTLGEYGIIDLEKTELLFEAALIANAFLFLTYSFLKPRRVMKQFRNCRLEEFIRFYSQEYRCSKNERIYRTSGINYAAGLCLKGNARGGADVLLKVGPAVNAGLGSEMVNFVYFNNLGAAYADMNELEAVKECLARIDEVVAGKKLPPKALATVEKYKLNMQEAILAGEKKYEAALQLILENGPMDKFLLSQVSYQFGLAVCYENLGELQKAMECYEFVAQNGGDTFYAARAKEKLAAKPE